MSERASFRGAQRGTSSRGGGGRGGSSNRGGASGGSSTEKPKKENILDLSKYMDKEIVVKFNGGREGLFLATTKKKGGLRERNARADGGVVG